MLNKRGFIIEYMCENTHLEHPKPLLPYIRYKITIYMFVVRNELTYDFSTTRKEP
jgi:hypothetical protein